MATEAVKNKKSHRETFYKIFTFIIIFPLGLNPAELSVFRRPF